MSVGRIRYSTSVCVQITGEPEGTPLRVSAYGGYAQRAMPRLPRVGGKLFKRSLASIAVGWFGFVAVRRSCRRTAEYVEPCRVRPAAGRWFAIHSALRHIEAAGLL